MPLGVTFAFLVSAPMVNEVALVLLWGLFGPTIAVAYLVAGLLVAIGAGLVVSRLHLERFVEPYVYEIHAGPAIEIHPDDGAARPRRLGCRPARSCGASRPGSSSASRSGRSSTATCRPISSSRSADARTRWRCPLVVMLGVPLYANAAGTIPIVEALLGKGTAASARSSPS